MKQPLLSETWLRTWWARERADTCCVEEGTLLTPAARDFLREHGIRLTFRKPGPETMTRTKIPVRDGRAIYVDASTGRELECKPEDMTHLRGNLLVSKSHPRIEFRGRLDSLVAQVLEVQLLAKEEQNLRLLGDLEEILAFLRRILAAEVKDEPLPELALLGMDSAGLRRASHNIRETCGIDHPVPDAGMGRMCVALNRLRTQVREAELSAVRAFPAEENGGRPDLIEALNRLSSGVYILFCRTVAERREGSTG